MRRLRDTARSEDGFTLIEMLIAASLGLIIVGAALSMFVGGVKSQPRATAQSAGVTQAQTAMERMTRELRQGSAVITATATQIAVITYVEDATCGGAAGSVAISCRVTYSCSSGACTRTVAQPNGSAPGSARTVVSGMSSSNVFSYVPNTAGSSDCAATGSGAPNYVCVTLAFPDNGGRNAITLSDGVGLRNS
jgi:prepilin-type N-terminal cleavage/methylation domain-containing protein